jgi:hypothetical protein
MFKPTTPDPAVVNFSTAFYHLLLIFYPTRFRREYGPHMAQVFRDCCLKTYQKSGLSGMLTLWALTFFDWFKTMIEEQGNRETEMTRAKFIRLSGWGMMLGAVSMALSILSDPITIRAGLSRLLGYPRTLAEYNTYRTFSEEVGGWLILLAGLLLIKGIAGLRLLYGKPAGALGNYSLLASMAGCGMLFLATLFSFLVEWDGWWGVMILGMIFLFGGLAVFGIAALQTKPMPRGNGLPLLAGFWFPVFFLVSLGIDLVTSGESWWDLPGFVFNGMTLITMIGLVLLGYLLQANTQKHEVIA